MQWKYLLPLFLGTLMGVIGGAIPGVTITLTIIILLPFTFGLDPLQGLAAMTGDYGVAPWQSGNAVGHCDDLRWFPDGSRR